MTAKNGDKPRKPYPEFPLSYHKCGQWVKKIRGKLHYFGTDAEAALQKYLNERDDLQAGRKPQGTTVGLCLADMINTYLADAKARRDAGELSPLSFRDYKWTGEQVVDFFGRNSDPCQIRPTEFAAFRNDLAARYAPSRLGKTVTVCRMMFTWAYESEVIDVMPRFGPNFKASTKRAARIAKAEAGPKSFTAGELKALLKESTGTFRTMILLGLNAGFGNNDVSLLPLDAVDLDAGWIDFPRPKTGIPRRVPLWSETLKALTEAVANRPDPKHEEHTNRVFLTARGGEWLVIREDGSRVDKITLRFRDLMKDCGCYRKGRGIYGLRHTLETVGGGAKDQVALDLIMGHVDASMANNYRHEIDDSRLKAVANHVRKWLYGKRTG